MRGGLAGSGARETAERLGEGLGGADAPPEVPAAGRGVWGGGEGLLVGGVRVHSG